MYIPPPPPPPPRHVFANTRIRGLKNLTFPNHKFGRGQYAVYPVKLSRFAEKIKFSEIPEFHPYELGRRPLQPMKNEKSPSLSGGVLVIQTS